MPRCHEVSSLKSLVCKSRPFFIGLDPIGYICMHLLSNQFLIIINILIKISTNSLKQPLIIGSNVMHSTLRQHPNLILGQINHHKMVNLDPLFFFLSCLSNIITLGHLFSPTCHISLTWETKKLCTLCFHCPCIGGSRLLGSEGQRVNHLKSHKGASGL